jgi:hypothetical protein
MCPHTAPHAAGERALDTRANQALALYATGKTKVFSPLFFCVNQALVLYATGKTKVLVCLIFKSCLQGRLYSGSIQALLRLY